jgi:hypothetical protein
MVDDRVPKYAVHFKDLQGIKPNDGKILMIYPAIEVDYVLGKSLKYLKQLEKIFSAIRYQLWPSSDIKRTIEIIKNTLST